VITLTRRDWLKGAGATVWAAVVSRRPAVAAETGDKPQRPNFVIIFIDDMGYGDIEPFGSKLNNTPHLNRMASEGMKLTSFYVAAPVCTPSRAALMTGCYPKRVGLATGSWHGVLFPGDRHGLNPSEITIAEVLKQAGYATGCFGKWHLGDQPQFLPTKHGFDEYFGIPYSNDMWAGHRRWAFSPLPLVRGEKVVGEVKTGKDQAQLCKRFTDAAVDFIRRHKDRPFFVYLPHAFIHGPRHARAEFMAKAKNRDKATGAQIEEVDWSAGQVLGVLRELKLDTKTLVVFTSDNGGSGGCVNAPLRGGKGSGWEGGMREPTLAWWPKHIPAKSSCDEIATTMDLLPTFANLAGTKTPTDRTIDGKDITSLLLAKQGVKTPHDAFYYYRGNHLFAVRSGRWKLIARGGALYNLDADIGEKRNVASRNRGVVKRLRRLLAIARADLGDGPKPGKGCRPVGLAANPRVLLPRPGVDGPAATAPVGPKSTK